MRAGQPDAPGNFVDIKDPLTGKTLATYLEHASEGFWNVVEPARAAPPADVALKRPLRAIEAQAQTVKDERAGIDRSIHFQQRKLNDPADWKAWPPMNGMSC